MPQPRPGCPTRTGSGAERRVPRPASRAPSLQHSVGPRVLEGGGIMGAAHWHLLLTHVPVVGAVFGFMLLVVAVLTANQAIRRLSLGALELVALLALPTYFTGEPAEEAVERLPGVSEPIIDRHQTAATASFAAVEVLGGLALLALALG